MCLPVPKLVSTLRLSSCRLHDKLSEPEPESKSSFLLSLPAELILQICRHLPLECKASLALANRRLYHTIGSSVWKELSCPYPPNFWIRSSRSFFLRRLQRDKPDEQLYICYRCLCFHSRMDPTPRIVKRSWTQNCQVGFPWCYSEYSTGIREIYSQLNNHRDQVATPRVYEDEISSPVRGEYALTYGYNSKDLFMLRKYILRAKRIRYEKYFMVPSSFLRTSNLEICPHIAFGYDYVKGDGSINDALHEYYLKQAKSFKEVDPDQKKRGEWCPEPFTGFVCESCWLDIEIHFVGLGNMDVRISVWQHLGEFKVKPSPSRSIVCMGHLRVLVNVQRKQRVESFRTKSLRAGSLQPGTVKRAWEDLPVEEKGHDALF